MSRVKNFVPAISLVGFEVANDGHRGQDVYDMALLKPPIFKAYHDN